LQSLDFYFFKPTIDTVCNACAYLDKAVYFKEKIFKNKNLQSDVSAFFHELSHIKTENNNNHKSFIDNDEFITYFNFDFRYKIPVKLNLALYYLSPNELNSRKKEIVYSKRFIERAKLIMENDPEYDTKKSKKILNRFEKNAVRHNKATNENIKKFNELIDKNLQKIQKKAEDNLRFIKDFDERKIQINQEKKMEAKVATDFLICYFGIFKDEKLYNEVFNHLKKYSYSVLNDQKKYLLQTNCKRFKREEIDEIIISLNDYNDTINSELNNEDIAKHNLLFYGSYEYEGISGLNNKTDKEKIVKNLKKELKDYIFTGIPYVDYFDKEKGKHTYELIIKGETKKFYSFRELMLEASKHINSTWLDDLNEEKINKLNSTFDKEIVIDFTKESMKKTNSKDKTLLNNNILQETNELTF